MDIDQSNRKPEHFQLVPLPITTPSNVPPLHFPNSPQFPYPSSPFPVAQPSFFTPVTPVFGTTSFYPTTSTTEMPPNPFSIPTEVSNVSGPHDLMIDVNEVQQQQRTPASSLTQRWEDFNFIHSPQQRARNESIKAEDEDLTIRIKMGLLKSIQKGASYGDINHFHETENFFMDIDGLDSTKAFYGKYKKSRFNLNVSQSGSPNTADNAITNQSREESDSDLQLIVPIVK